MTVSDCETMGCLLKNVLKKKSREKKLSENFSRAFWILLREFQELISFVNVMGNHWKIMVFSHGAKSRELQKKIWEVKKSEINFKKSGHHNTSISAHLEHPSTHQTCSGSLLNPLPPSQDGSLNTFLSQMRHSSQNTGKILYLYLSNTIH